jgi:hypothetical protein
MSSSVPFSPSRVGSVSGKSGTLLSQAKPILNEQHNRLANKHLLDLDLIDDLRTFIKSKCSIEKDYSQSLIKLANSQSKKYPNFSTENDSQIKYFFESYLIFKTFENFIDFLVLIINIQNIIHFLENIFRRNGKVFKESFVTI